VDDLRYGPASRYLWMVGLGIGCTLAVVVGAFELLISVGVLSHDGPSDSLFLTALVGVGLGWAVFIALHTRSVWNGIFIAIVVPGLVVGGLFFMVSRGPHWHSEPATDPVSTAPGP
jgi:hypothetical protein